MSSAYSNLFIDQGTTFSTTIVLDDVYGNAYNLSNFVVNSAMRKSPYNANVVATFVTSITANTGTITLSLPSTVTYNIAGGRYSYDAMLVNNSANTVIKILEGIVYVNPSSTR